MTLDLDFARAQFPALSGEWTFMDNAGGSQVLRRVAERVSDYLLATNVQTGASYEPSRISTARVSQSREAFARFMNCEPGEIVEGPSTTILIRFLSEAMTGRLQPGDEIILTNTDHEANIGPWLKHEARGVKIRWWRCDPETFELDLQDLKGLMSERTKLVCVTHASNILGTINPIREIADIAHAGGAELCVDAVAYAPHRAIDVKAFDADYYIFSVYKVFGPHHAVMFGKRDKLLALDNIYHYFFDKTRVPHKLEPGNINYECAWGSIGSVDYVEELGARAGAGQGAPRSRRALPPSPNRSARSPRASSTSWRAATRCASSGAPPRPSRTASPRCPSRWATPAPARWSTPWTRRRSASATATSTPSASWRNTG